MEAIGFLIALVVFILFIFITRWLGAWMLRIDEIIKELKRINRSINNNK